MVSKLLQSRAWIEQFIATDGDCIISSPGGFKEEEEAAITFKRLVMSGGRVRSFHTVHFNDADRPTFIVAADANLASLYSSCCLFCFSFSFRRACFVPTTAVNVFNAHGRIIF